MKPFHRSFFVYLLINLLCILLATSGQAESADIPPASAIDFHPAAVFSDNMVIQQNAPICIWGNSTDEGSVVHVKLEDSFGYSYVENGLWEVELAPRCTNTTPLTLEIYGSPNAEYRLYENIRIGDVWLIIGQSNVEYRYGNLKNNELPETVSAYSDMFSVLSFNSADLKKVETNGKIEQEQSDLPDTERRWLIGSHGSNINASALGVCFAGQLCSLSRGEIPIGIVSLGFSGKALSAFVQPSVADTLSGYEQKSCIYNAFLAPLLKMPFCGMVWYQGEANAAYYAEYRQGFQAFIEKLREDIGWTVPVYIVELPPCFPTPQDYTGSDWQFENFGSVRAVTGILPLDTEQVYICPTSDLYVDRNEPNSLHPANKKQIAERLAGMAAANTWGMHEFDLLCAPTVRKIVVTETENTATQCDIYFDHIGTGLAAYKNHLNGFDAIGEHWQFVPITAEITAPDRITISSQEKIYILRYGADTSRVFGEDFSLCNSAGIPAASFTYTVTPVPSPLSARLHIVAVKIIGFLYPFRVLILILFITAAFLSGFMLCKHFRKKRHT